jgi:hypothetical protein
MSGNVIDLRPHLRGLPTTLPPRELKTSSWLPRVRDVLETGLYAKPETQELMAGVNNDTAVFGRVAFDEKAVVDKVVEALGKANIVVERQDYAKVAKAISKWMKERDISRRARRLEARQQVLIAAAAAQ